MAYANLDLDFFEHRKTKRLVGQLGAGAEIYAIRLWVYCGKFHAEDGRLEGYSDQEIESILGWSGEPGKMLVLLAACFVHREEGTIVVHDWLEHQGHIARFKQRGKDMAARRWGKKGQCDALRNASSIPASSAVSDAPKDASSNAPTVPTVPTECVYTRTHQHEQGIGKEEEFAHVPTVEDVIARADMLAIPPSYARHYHERCEILKRWITGQGRLIDWARELPRWWSRDRGTWKETAADGRSAEEIEAELAKLNAVPETSEIYAKKSALIDELLRARKRK